MSWSISLVIELEKLYSFLVEVDPDQLVLSTAAPNMAQVRQSFKIIHSSWQSTPPYSFQKGNIRVSQTKFKAFFCS